MALRDRWSIVDPFGNAAYTDHRREGVLPVGKTVRVLDGIRAIQVGLEAKAESPVIQSGRFAFGIDHRDAAKRTDACHANRRRRISVRGNTKFTMFICAPGIEGAIVANGEGV